MTWPTWRFFLGAALATGALIAWAMADLANELARIFDATDQEAPDA